MELRNRTKSPWSVTCFWRRKALFLGSACLFTLFNSCEKPQEQKESKAVTPYVQREYRFSIQFPAGWRVKDTGTNSVVKSTHILPNGKYGASILIYADPPGSLTNTWEVSAESLFRGGGYSTLLDSGRMELNGLKATWIKHTIEDSMAGKKTAITYLVIVNDHLIKMVCFATPEKYEEYSPAFERTAKSFRKLDS